MAAEGFEARSGLAKETDFCIEESLAAALCGLVLKSRLLAPLASAAAYDGPADARRDLLAADSFNNLSMLAPRAESVAN